MALRDALRAPAALGRAEKTTIQSFERLKKTAADARLPYDKDVWLNVAFYLDEQYVEWISDSAMIRQIPRPEGMENSPRPVANKIMHFVAQEHAFALKTRPAVDCLPATEDPLDIYITAPALAYLRWLAEPQVGDWDRELSDATLWALAGGEGYIKWTYNEKEGRPDFCSVSPLDLYTDPYVKDFRKSRYAIHSQFMDVEQVFDLYGVEVQPSDMQNADPMKTALLRDMGQAPVLTGVNVNELWMLPSRRHPKGLFAVWSDNKLLVEPRPFPYAHGKLPFSQIGSVPRPGSSHYTCAVKYMRSPQMELNKYHAQKILTRENFAVLKWWVPAELELESPPDDSPFQVLTGQSAGGQLKPEIIQPPSMPDNGDGAWITDEMNNIVGLHEVSQGQVPGRVEAAKAIEALKESDADRLSELLRTTQSAISEGYWQCLMLLKQYVPEDQVVQAYSRDGAPEVHRLKTASLKPGMRVRVTMGTGLARSRAAREDQVMNLVQNGILRDPEVIAELLDVPVGQFTPSKVYDIRLARNENLTMADGTPITPNSWDDHAIHLREHNNYRKTTEFLGLAPVTKQKFEYHCQMHDQLEVQQLQKMALKQQVLAAAMQPPSTDPAQSGPGQPADQQPQDQGQQAA